MAHATRRNQRAENQVQGAGANGGFRNWNAERGLPNVFGGGDWHEPNQDGARAARRIFERRQTGPDEHAHLRVD